MTSPAKGPDTRLDALVAIGLTKEQYVELTDETCREELKGDLKFAGIPKPPLVSDKWWNGGKPGVTMTPRRKQAIYLMALGKSYGFIAEELDYNYNTLVKFLNEPEVQQLIAHKQEMIFQNNAKGRIKSLMSDAYDVVDYILKDRNEKSSVRLDAAKYVIDHVVGKSAQAIEIKGNLLGDLLSQLDELTKMAAKDELPKVESVIDVTPSLPEAPPATETVVVSAPLAEERPDMNNLVSQLVKTDFVVGKRG